jgi:hypothetical protein
VTKEHYTAVSSKKKSKNLFVGCKLIDFEGCLFGKIFGTFQGDPWGIFGGRRGSFGILSKVLRHVANRVPKPHEGLILQSRQAQASAANGFTNVTAAENRPDDCVGRAEDAKDDPDGEFPMVLEKRHVEQQLFQ